MVKKSLLVVFACNFFLLGCKDSNQELIIEDLKMKNDSLTGILNDLNQRYIFDNISIRDIPSHENTYKSDSNVSGEIVIVGFNNSYDTNVILADQINHGETISLENPDTLKIDNGGFIYKRRLADSLQLKGLITVDSKYGKSHQAVYNTVIKAKDKP